MAYGVKIECWGPLACFTRPEMKVERVSYDIMTPSAARGLVEAIMWHPGMKYVIDEIDLLSPIKFTNVRRNEVKSKINVSSVPGNAKNRREMYLFTKDDIQQRAATVLKDVHYCIKLHFEMTDKASPGDNPGKFREMLCRRARKGQCFHQPYLGCREFPAAFRLVEDDENPIPYPETRDLGYMLYDMDFSDPHHIVPAFFHAHLENGVMDLRNCEVHQ
ncbi:type I-C CRISPR-associated protein Cas5c [Dialister sp.]|uniref:type I-C CRISPR-associated protein Cas5c n=1 Tax=Dialister sp. TaxID=1955814 RepID=UPI003EFE3B70